MTAQELKEGDTFILQGKRKQHTIKYANPLNGPNIPLQHKGKMLIVTDKCKQYILSPEREVKIL